MALKFQWLFIILISFIRAKNSKKKNNTKNFFNYPINTNKYNSINENISFINQPKRKLEDFEPIRIFVDTNQYELEIIFDKMKDYKQYLIDGINMATKTLSTLIKVKRLSNGVDISDINNEMYESFGFLEAYKNESLFIGNK